MDSSDDAQIHQGTVAESSGGASSTASGLSSAGAMLGKSFNNLITNAIDILVKGQNQQQQQQSANGMSVGGNSNSAASSPRSNVSNNNTTPPPPLLLVRSGTVHFPYICTHS